MNEAQKVQAIIEILRTGTGAQDAKRDLEGVQAAAGLLDGHLKALGGTLATVFSAREIIRFGAESLKAFSEAERGAQLLNGTLKASGQFSEAYVLQLRNLAGELAGVVRADDDAILAAERTMISFGGQRRDMERLTKAALDLSVGLGVDLQTAASQVGRAVAGETMSFNRLGFEIDENADAVTRLDQVLSQIGTRFGGLAESEMNTLEGATDDLTEAWGELKEAVGAVLGPGAAAGLRVAAGELKALQATLNRNSQDEERATVESELARLNQEGKINPLVYLAQQKQLEQAFAARKEVSQVVVADPEFQRMETITASEVDREARAAALQMANAQLGRALDFEQATRESAARNTGRAGNEFYGPPEAPVGEQFGPTNAEANEQRRRLAREATDEIRSLEQALTLDQIRLGEGRSGAAQAEYERRVALYSKLASEHKLSEDELTRLTGEAAFDRDRTIEESIAQQRRLERDANEERRREYQQLGNQIANIFANQVSSAIVQGFRTGKFEADRFFSDLLAQISQAIIQFLILRAIMGIAGSITGGGGGISGGVDIPATTGLGLGGAMPAAEGLTQLNHATFFPKFNVVAGEAGMEMMTVLARPRPMAFGGVQAMTGFAQGRELAVMSAGGAAALAGQGGGGREAAVVRVMLDPGLKAEIVRESVGSAEVQITQSLGRDTGVRRAVQAVAGG